MKKINQHVRFRGGGFKTEHADEFAGRDLAEYLAAHLQQNGFVVNAVEYEEPWFTVTVVSGAIEYPVMVSYSAMKEGYREVSCPRTLGFFARLGGKSEDTELENLTNTLNKILRENETITDIKWYSDYSTLTDDYIQKPAARYLATFGNYLEKVFLPVCATGWVLALIGGINGGKESLLLRIGAIMFMGPIILWFCLFVLNISVAFMYDIKGTHRERSRKKWLRWLAYCLILSAMILPFFLGVIDIPSDKVMPSVEKFMFGAMAALLFGGMLFAAFCGAMSDVQKQKKRTKKLLYVIGFTCIFFWITGFFGGALCSLGVLQWIPDRIEFPLALVEDLGVSRDGDLFVLVRFYGRIQVYDKNGDFVRGWFFYAPSGKVYMIVNENNTIAVEAYSSDTIYTFNDKGTLLKTNEHKDMYSEYASEENTKHLFNESTGVQYDVEGFVFPKIIQSGPEGETEIGKNDFYLFAFQGPVQAFALGFTGMFIVSHIDKKRKKKRTKK